MCLRYPTGTLGALHLSVRVCAHRPLTENPCTRVCACSCLCVHSAARPWLENSSLVVQVEERGEEQC